MGSFSISLGRLGANVTGVDLSDEAIKRANELAEKTHVDAKFICCDIYDLPQHLTAQFDIVFTSYGTIGWLPDLDQWAKLISRFLKPNGKFVFVEFHPVVCSPYNCFNKTIEVEPKKYRIKHLSNHIPMVYSIKAEKKEN